MATLHIVCNLGYQAATTKEYKQVKEQTTIVVNGGKRVKIHFCFFIMFPFYFEMLTTVCKDKIDNCTVLPAKSDC